MRSDKVSRSIFELVLFSVLGAITFLSDILMEALPNVHLVGVLLAVYTVVFKLKAFIPLYVYVFLSGLFGGFSLWWIPYLYIWIPIVLLTLLVPKNAPRAVKMIVYPLIVGLNGFLFGTLYAPAQALMFGLDFKGMIAWIVAGIPFDLIHGAGNLVLGLFILPLSELFLRILKRSRFYKR